MGDFYAVMKMSESSFQVRYYCAGNNTHKNSTILYLHKLILSLPSNQGCGIHWLYLYKGLNPTNDTTSLATCNDSGRDPGDLIVRDQPKWSRNVQIYTFVHTGQYGQSERPDLINQLVMPSPSVYIIVPTVFFKLSLWQTTVFHIKDARRQWIRVNCAEIEILETI